MAKKQIGTKSTMPNEIAPMLATLVKDPVNSPEYLYEIKWDGYRIIAYVKGGQVRLASRSGLDYTARYPRIAEALKKLKHDVVIDGEVVVFNEEGKPDFDALQKYNGHSTSIHYCVFDLLWMDGNNLMSLPLTQRKELLLLLVEGNETLEFSESFDDGPALYQQMLEMDLEGILAKQKDSAYRPGDRGRAWLKTPTRKRQEFVIGGWAESDKERSFRSLLFGAYENGKLRWIGRSGGGFKEKEMPSILKKLKALEVEQSPFENKVLDTKGAVMHWVKPSLVANFEFAAWTKSGRIRKPATFLGLRLDKKPEQVVREVPQDLEKEQDDETSDADPDRSKGRVQSSPLYLNDDSNWRRVDESFEGVEETEIEMENCSVKFHGIERELWQGVPKAKLILYYKEISSFILPHLKDRPQSLNLKLTGAGGPTTFIKDMENRQPSCASVFSDERRVKKRGKRNQIDYLICNNVETLLYMVDWGCVDINPWASQIESPDNPNYIWLDLDPTVPSIEEEDQGFNMAVEIALAAKETLDKYKLVAFIKTSGKTGFHIYIPCSGITFKESRTIANNLADEIHELTPSISTRSENIGRRGTKVYIDANQNDYADTLAAPYSVRPYHQPVVSTPLEWKEVKIGLNRYQFMMESIQQRLQKKGDIFAKVLDRKIANSNTKKLFI